MKTLDTQEYIGMLRELILDGKNVACVVAGSSMSPFLVNCRDRIHLCPIDRPLIKGDMVFFQRNDRTFVMHRICRVDGSNYYLIGDAQQQIEGPIRGEQIFARVYAAERKGEYITDGDRCWDFFRYVWIRCIPFRPLLHKVYNQLH